MKPPRIKLLSSAASLLISSAMVAGGCGSGSDGATGDSGSNGSGANAQGGELTTGGDSAASGGKGTGNATSSGASSGTSGGNGAGGAGAMSDGGESVYQPLPPTAVDFEGGGSFFQGEDTCDGIDNDKNGIVDDVDVGQDGICDCLKIATVGRLGVWGSGNVFKDWLNTRGADPAADLGDQLLTPELLAPYQVIVMLDVSTVSLRIKGKTYPISHVYAAEEATAVEDWVRNGGGLMGTIGYTYNEAAEVTNVNELLAFSGLSYDAAHTDTEGDVSNWVAHPITSGMGVARIINGVRPITTSGVTLGWDVGNHEALQIKEVDDGRLALWGDEWITYDELWNNSTELDIELFWLNLIKWLTPPQQCQVPIPPIVH